MEPIKIMVDRGFSTNATTASMLVDLLFANPADKVFKELLIKTLLVNL